MAKQAESSVGFLAGIYVALMVLLGLTVLAAHFPLGAASLLIALAIAAAKALLVIFFFMHLREGSGTTRIFAAAGFLWLAIMLALTLGEYAGRTRGARAQPLNSAVPRLGDRD